MSTICFLVVKYISLSGYLLKEEGAAVAFLNKVEAENFKNEMQEKADNKSPAEKHKEGIVPGLRELYYLFEIPLR